MRVTYRRVHWPTQECDNVRPPRRPQLLWSYLISKCTPEVYNLGVDASYAYRSLHWCRHSALVGAYIEVHIWSLLKYIFGLY